MHSIQDPEKADSIFANVHSMQDPEEADTTESLDSLSREISSIGKTHTWPRDWRAYRALLGGFLLMFNSWGLVNAYGTFQSYYRSHLLADTPDALIPLIGGTQCFFILFASFIVGRFLDAGYHRMLGAAGGILTTLGMLLLSVSAGAGGQNEGKFWAVWLTQGLVVGLGMSCKFVYSSQVVAGWFVQRRGLAIGITASGASIAGLVYPVLFKIAAARDGFPTAVRYLAVVVAGTSLIAFLCAVPNPAATLRVPEKWLKREVWIDTNAFHQRPYTWFVAAMCFVFLGFYPIFFNLEDWAVWRGEGMEVQVGPGTGTVFDHGGFRTFYFLAIMNAFSSIGRILGAYLCDRFGALNVHLSATALSSVFILTFWLLTKNLATALAFVIVFGIVSGTVIGLPPACIASLLSESEQRRLGQWTGMMYSLTAVFSLLGPTLVGQLVANFGFVTVMAWSGSSLMAASACTMVARYKAGGLKKWKKVT